MIPERITYYCIHCGRKRMGPLASECNSLNNPCECGGSIHWSTEQPRILPFKLVGENKVQIGDNIYEVYQTKKTDEKEGITK